MGVCSFAASINLLQFEKVSTLWFDNLSVVCQIVAAALLKIDGKLAEAGIRLILIGTSSPAQTK